MSVRSARLLTSPTARAIAATSALALALLLAYELGSGSPQQAQAAPGAAAAGQPAPSSGVEVVGTGKVAGTPDVLRLDLAISVTRSDAAGALSGASSAAAKVIKALKGRGVRDKDIKTAGLSLQPNYDYSGGKSTINGYTSDEQIAVTLRNLKTAGAAITSAVAAGGDSARVNGLALDLEGDSGLLVAARKTAINDAHSKAEAYAKAAGRDLGAVQVISEDTRPAPPIQLGRAAASDAAAGAPVPVQAGSQQVSVSVRVVWSFA